MEPRGDLCLLASAAKLAPYCQTPLEYLAKDTRGIEKTAMRTKRSIGFVLNAVLMVCTVGYSSSETGSLLATKARWSGFVKIWDNKHVSQFEMGLIVRYK